MTIQSAVYLQGNKRKLWSRIKPHLEGGEVLIDLFTGSGSIALNCVNEGLFNTIISNDSLAPLVEMHKSLQTEEFLKKVKEVNSKYPETKEGYYKMRDDYNRNRSPELLLNLQYRSNSNMMRFNKSGEFNMTYGERARYDEDKLLQHHNLCKSINFTGSDFDSLIVLIKSGYDLSKIVFYIDPPYSNTTAVYNEQGGWDEPQDMLLLYRVEQLRAGGAKIVMSNVFENRGKENTWLKEWCEANKEHFDVHHLNNSYGNSSFRKSNCKTDEVLIVSK